LRAYRSTCRAVKPFEPVLGALQPHPNMASQTQAFGTILLIYILASDTPMHVPSATKQTVNSQCHWIVLRPEYEGPIIVSDMLPVICCASQLENSLLSHRLGCLGRCEHHLPLAIFHDFYLPSLHVALHLCMALSQIQFKPKRKFRYRN